ncbi:zinc ribbon domain-containing protein [Paenibacillus lutrae]|uniref:Zinc ribbon domain-containing protein n=1 Tax=Paenibacillus lutrae TaxID=2078573 RepID=A0A7X3K063_9BACL|nr:zinc ribbon domain-containing protein [Paenibacillus lutrae]MVP00790.1 hypothetical protein [Paenibacillus lutrae]
MATVVLHKVTGKVYLLLGTGYGAYYSESPSFIGGALFPHERSGEIPVAAVCTKEGVIEWMYTDELQVVEVDGIPVSELYGRIQGKYELAPAAAGHDETQEGEPAYENCPGCGRVVPSTERVCPGCGLTLISEEGEEER